MSASRYPESILAQLRNLAESRPEEEVCGFVVRRGDGALEVIPLRNALGPGTAIPGLPQSPARGYLADPVAHLRLVKRLRAEGGEVVATFHSHVEAKATFSDIDREFALADGAPLWPGVDYIVVALSAGSATEIRKFSWNGSTFCENLLWGQGLRDPPRRAP